MYVYVYVIASISIRNWATIESMYAFTETRHLASQFVFHFTRITTRISYVTILTTYSYSLHNYAITQLRKYEYAYVVHVGRYMYLYSHTRSLIDVAGSFFDHRYIRISEWLFEQISGYFYLDWPVATSA